MEEIIEKTKQLSWNDLSGLLKPNRCRANSVHKALLVGKLVSKKVHPFHILQLLILSGWRFISDLKVEDAGDNRYIFTFASLVEKVRILYQGPWNFKGSYLILREWDPSTTLDEVDLSMVEFWVQIYGLPLELVAEDNARLIGSMLGMILELDNVDEHQSFIRLKINFPSSKPLEPSFNYFQEDGGSVWIGFKYERLSSFCSHCGLMDHTIGACYQNPQHPLHYALSNKMRFNSAMPQMGEQHWRGVQGRIPMESRQVYGMHGSPLVASVEGQLAASSRIRDMNGNPSTKGLHGAYGKFQLKRGVCGISATCGLHA